MKLNAEIWWIFLFEITIPKYMELTGKQTESIYALACGSGSCKLSNSPKRFLVFASGFLNAKAN